MAAVRHLGFLKSCFFLNSVWYSEGQCASECKVLACLALCALREAGNRLVVLIQYRSVTDRQTHRHTTTAYTTLSIALRGKNMTGLVGGPDQSSTAKKLSFDAKIVKIGPVDLEIICLREITSGLN